MTKKIIGNLEVGRNAISESKNLVRTVEGAPFDDNGHLEIDSYNQDEFNKIISVLPLSHYGSFNYLPAGVYGSYEGASDPSIYRYRKLYLEDDGSLIILRPGTNGAKRGVYYSIIDNALNSTSLNNSVNTNKEYKPGYFGNTYTAQSVYASDSKVVSGLAFNTSNAQFVFISLMNGTLNDSQHPGLTVPISALLPNGGFVSFVMTGNTDVYFFIDVSTSTALTYEIRSIPISNIQSGSGAVITTHSGWNSTGFYGNTTSSTALTLIPRISSSSSSDQPYVLYPASTINVNPYMGNADLYAAQSSDGTIRMRVVGDCWCTTALRNTRPKHSFNFLLNISSKTATLEPGSTAPLTITDPGSGTSLVATGNTITTDSILTFNGVRANFIMSYLYLETGEVFATATYGGQIPTYIQRAYYPNTTSVYDTIQVRNNTSTNFLNKPFQYSFGSPVGFGLMGFEWLPNNRYKVISTTNKVTNSLNEYKPGATFSFDSVSMGTILGFEPTTNRIEIPNDPDHKLFISSINGSTVTTNGGVFVENYKVSSGIIYDENMNSTGTMSVPNSLLTSFKLSQLPSTGIDMSNVSNITLYVPQQTDIPAFAVITAVTTSQTNYTKVIEVNVDTRTGSISTLTFSRLVHESTGSIVNLSQPATFGVQDSSIGITIYDAGSFYFIGGVDPYVYKTIGDASAITWRAKVTKSTVQMDSFVVSGFYSNHVQSSSSIPWAVPGIGFGYINFSSGSDDDNTRVIFQPVGTTLSQYNAWTDTGSQILLAGQDVAQGFILYFTELTPVLLSGKSFVMPIQNLDLKTVKTDPSNSTFYIYVTMEEGLARYFATETVIAESGTSAYNTFWIGTVTTNALQIDNITIHKRSRLDVFGASLEAAGSSFPVSYGVPSSTGTINW